MRFRSIQIDKLGHATDNLPPFLVVNARRSRWARWLDDPSFLAYDYLAQSTIAEDWWDTLNDWFEVGRYDCEECGHPQPVCERCRAEAIYLLEWDDLDHHEYLCSDCGQPYVKINEVHEQFLEEIGWPEMEVGLYACCDGCECDHWY